MSENIKKNNNFNVPYDMKLSTGKNKNKDPSNIRQNTTDNNISRNLNVNSTMSLNQSAINNNKKDSMLSPNNQISRTKVFYDTPNQNKTISPINEKI